MVLIKNWILKRFHKLNPDKPLVEDKDYVICDHDNLYILKIKLLNNEFHDAIVGFIVDETIEYQGYALPIKSVLVKPSIINPIDFTSSEKWCILGPQIFENCFIKVSHNYKLLREEILSDENDRTDYFEEPVPQRTVYKKGTSVPKKRVFSEQKRKNSVSRDSISHSKVQPPANNGVDPDILGE